MEKFDGRLRDVEKAVVRIETKLDNVPTKTEAWRALAVTGGTVLVGIGGFAIWAVKEYLAPILKQLGAG